MFDVLEARLNRAVLAKLANAVATINGQDFPVIFDAEYRQGKVGQVGMGGSSPQLAISSAAAPDDIVGMAITVNSSAWEVSDRQPDSEAETGLTVLYLVKA